MVRVCRPGGKIGLATPIADGWSGDFFATIANYTPPLPGLNPTLRWGTDAGIEQLLGSGTRSIENEQRTALQYYRSVDHAVEVFHTYFGPAVRASSGSREQDREKLGKDLHAVFTRHNRATDGTAVIENRYLLTVATRA